MVYPFHILWPNSSPVIPFHSRFVVTFHVYQLNPMKKRVIDSFCISSFLHTLLIVSSQFTPISFHVPCTPKMIVLPLLCFICGPIPLHSTITPSGPLLLLPVLAFTSLFCTFYPSHTALKMGAARSSYTLVSIYQFTLHHNPGDGNTVLYLYCAVV
jgi:hypothetical protein